MIRRLDLPHVAFLCVLGGWTLWYLLDAWFASADLQNLGLIAPVSIIVLVLCALGLAATPVIRPTISTRILGTMGLLGAYVLTMDRIGFDLATWLYVLASLLLLGERRTWLLAAVPLIFAALATFAFANLLQTPMPLLFGAPQ